MSSTMRGALLVGLAALAVGGWWWWSGPERQIRRLLADVAAVLSHQDGRSALGGVTAAAGLHRHLDEAIVVEPGQPFEPITGRDAVIAAALRLQTPGQGMRVTFEDVRVAVAPDGATATVDATVTA